MTPLIENVWNIIVSEYDENFKNNKNFEFDQTQKDVFKKVFTEEYRMIMNKYMDDSVEYLDRHKVAALIIVSLLKIDAISYKNLDDDCIFIGCEVLSLKAGLAYMLEKLNEKLISRGSKKQIKMIEFPNAQSCETSYMDIICRNLYYCKTDYQLNPLDIADRLFLLEYITLVKENVNPDILKDY